MEFKDPVGAPAAAAAATFNGTHPKAVSDFANMPTPTSPLRPDATRATPPSSQPSSSTPATNSDQNSMHTIAATPLAAISPPAYMPANMATAIVPHSGAPTSLPNPSFGDTGSMKKKRGRPRKYGPDGTVTITIKQFPSPPSMNPLSPLQKRGRGRPPGSGKNQQLAALGDLLCASAGAGFTPHAITVAAGEDVAAKIMSFSQQGPRGICILSANGAISNVTLRQPAVSGGTVTYEGRFEILSLSGSFLVTEFCRTGGLSVSLAGPDGRVIGGSVAGMLMAASPVQVVVGSFLCLSKKSYTKPSKVDDASKLSTSTGVPAANTGNNAAPEPPLNDRTDSKQESPPHNQSSGHAASSNDESPQGQMIAVQMGWPAGSQEVRRSTDISNSSPGQ
ncbi:hypothetical protein GOP47_0017871 [Adiantum capillus-veneris]|uniref:AT-hook motif nuclear-localized protein n=1 Tax=Adiantum capillus-veneris TaxID=13818 RepID=A0A9D4Z9L8_ADICA|nr:hypothetical protein GOP47_0017871 [Adiantum capillus-veneris]